MKKLIFAFCCLLVAVTPHNALSATKDLTITWSIPDNDNVTGYRMYYSYDSSMTNKILACETGDPDATSLTCQNIELIQSPVYAMIAAIVSDREIFSNVKSQTIPLQITPVQGFKIISSDISPNPSTYKLKWSFSGDNIDSPPDKEAKRVGNGKYISNGCYDNSCYDNTDVNSFVTIPVTNNDIIDPNNFEISLYFNPKLLVNYSYVFSIAADNNNAHKVHVYENGNVYCRTILDGTQYYGYFETAPIVTGTWYKLTYSFSSNQIKLSINDGPVKIITTTTSFVGSISEIRLADSVTDGYSLNCLLDNMTIK